MTLGPADLMQLVPVALCTVVLYWPEMLDSTEVQNLKCIWEQIGSRGFAFLAGDAWSESRVGVTSTSGNRPPSLRIFAWRRTSHASHIILGHSGVGTCIC